MRIYLDDDLASPNLARLLRNAGHDAQLPVEANFAGENDAVHLRHAVRDQRVLLTRNHDDFEDLHELLLAARGHHPGILVVRQDNKPKRDMTRPTIVRAIGKLEASGMPIVDQFIILNHWR
jgi:predicted nuclease of predicted toxin-antitoxin system